MGNRLHAICHGFHLNGDIWDDAKDIEQSNQRAKGEIVAIAARNEVGEVGDALLLANPDHFFPNQGYDRHEKGRADVNREELQTGLRCVAYAAKESPSRAVNGDGQGIDIFLAHKAIDELRLSVGQAGQTKKERQVSDKNAYDAKVAHLACVCFWN